MNMKWLKILVRIILAAAALLLLIVAAVILFLYFYPPVGQLPGKNEQAALEKESDRYFDGQFHNANAVNTMTGNGYSPSDRRIPEKRIAACTPAFLTDPQEGDLSFTWIGHSSFFLQLGTVNVLVDPVLSNRTSPVGFAGPKRFSELPLTAQEFPRIDVLFLSHDHYDHLDYPTFLAIRDQVGAFVVPLGVDAILKGWGVDAAKITALDWWESTEINGVSITLTPSQHFTGRNPLRGNRTLWGGAYIDDGYHRVYYTGDGGYQAGFKEVRNRLGAPDLMIAECGQYDPAWSQIHMFPEETVQAGKDVEAKWLIPVHWGSFSICNHAWDDPILRVTAAAETADLPLASPQIGQTVRYDELAVCTERWWEAYA